MATRWIWIRRHRAVVAAAALGLPDLQEAKSSPWWRGLSGGDPG